jgi:dihydrofolate reductase
MRKLVLLMHTSLDGFVAGPNGEMDWIQVGEELFDVVGEKTAEADTALYGRVTFQMMEGYWPTAGDEPGASKHDLEHSKWYNTVKKVVVTKTLNYADYSNTSIIRDEVPSSVNALKQLGGKDILIIGSPSVVHALLEDNLIDEYWLMVNPVLLGKGIPLFKNIWSIKKLKLEDVLKFNSGVVCLHYTSDGHR